MTLAQQNGHHGQAGASEDNSSPQYPSTAHAQSPLKQNSYLRQGIVQTDTLSPASVGDPVGYGLDGYTLNPHSSHPSPLSSSAVATPPSVTMPPLVSDNFTSNRLATSSQSLMPPPIDQSHALSQVDGFDFAPFAQTVSNDNFLPQTFPNQINFSSFQNNYDSSLQVSTSSQPPHAYHTLAQHSTHPHLHSYMPSQNGFHDATTHPLSKTTSVSSLTSSIASLQNFSDFSSPHSSHGTPLAPSQDTPLAPDQMPDTECLDRLLNSVDHTPISPEQIFQSTENDSLEQILSDMILLNQGGGAVGVGGGGRISVECEVHGVDGYHDNQFSTGNQEAEDVIQQFMS